MPVIFGALIGLLNGFFGSGGGILAVTFLGKSGLDAKSSHATSLALMLVLSVISLAVYYFNGNLSITQGLPFFIPAVVGSMIGAWALKKIPAALLKFIFAVIILYSSVRMLLG